MWLLFPPWSWANSTQGSQPVPASKPIFRQFLAKPGVQVFSVTTGVAARYGSIVHTLRRAGTPIPTNDIWIAAITLECGARLVTLDTHFDTIPTLIVDRYEPVE